VTSPLRGSSFYDHAKRNDIRGRTTKRALRNGGKGRGASLQFYIMEKKHPRSQFGERAAAWREKDLYHQRGGTKNGLSPRRVESKEAFQRKAARTVPLRKKVRLVKGITKGLSAQLP